MAVTAPDFHLPFIIEIQEQKVPDPISESTNIHLKF